MAAARRWAAWPHGAEHHARLVAAIDELRRTSASDPERAIADLRAVLEWMTYQSAILNAARTVMVARRTRALSRRLGLLVDDSAPLQTLADAESSLIEHVRERNAYMTAIAAQRPHLGLPPPLIAREALAAVPEQPPTRLALIQRLRANIRRKE
jgi:hypothetical protein